MIIISFIRCVIRMCGIGAIVGFLFALIPARFFNLKLFRKTYPYEEGGIFYEKYFKISKWKDHIPQFSKIFHFGYRKDVIPQKTVETYDQFVVETIRAEVTHILLILFSPLYYLSLSVPDATFTVVASIVANGVCILIQRYNRIRILRIIERMKKKFKNSSEKTEEN